MSNPLADVLEGGDIPPHLAEDHIFLIDVFREALRRADIGLMLKAANVCFAGPLIPPGAWESVLAPMAPALLNELYKSAWNNGVRELARRIARLPQRGSEWHIGSNHRDRVPGCDSTEKNQRFATLSQTNFNGLTYADFDFAFADLTYARLENCNLVGCSFRGVTAVSANFFKANARDTDFSGANLWKGSFGNVTIAGSKFTNCNLQEARMSGNGVGACFDGASCVNATFQGDFEGVSFKRANLTNAILNRLYAPDPDFEDAFLYKANMAHGHFLRGNFANATLEDADFTHANLEGANLHWAKIRGATFREASLAGVDLCQFSREALESCTFFNTDITGAQFDEDLFGEIERRKAGSFKWK